jgi:hypothetical protein
MEVLYAVTLCRRYTRADGRWDAEPRCVPNVFLLVLVDVFLTCSCWSW